MLNCYSPKNNADSMKGKIDTFLLSIIVITLIIFGGVIYFGLKTGTTAQVSSDSRVKVVIDSFKHDWGTIDINGGKVTKSFSLKNDSNSTLKLYEIQTSCMCTTAQLKTKDLSSKKFGMHEKSAEVFEVKPGEAAELLVEFDPAFHGPSGTGPIDRVITLKTNSLENPELSFQLTANVVKN